MQIKIQESFNYCSHLAGGIAALVGTIYLAKVASSSASALITALIYGLSIVFLFSASTLYHIFKKEENELSFWRKMDRLAIFFMIAGTYTPICYFCMEGYWRWSMIAIQWGLVGFGFISQLFFPRAPRILYFFIYVIMGWATLFPMQQVLANLTLLEEVLLFTGGAAFTLGGLIYAVKRPRLIPGIFGFHELFHVMILIGGALHYAMIYRVYFGIAASA
ncbi:MAG: hemolysin III family protein [Proteobacteria bacterium]|nr:hemolysin III family protein [Pseudomonadota bacterium]MBU1387348.1 hemolysin III family protein [Pseudomonadota bacterium]MBU1541633.1 hemolysin III family protein [Pseudomonadota bacterium]MBU2482068.1 hemolysin III family protein [Pseudomonadota bacterium]